jgi:type IV pilus assembly protein PilM
MKGRATDMFGITSETSLGIEITDQRLLLAEVRKKRDKFQLQGVVQAAIPSEVMEEGRIKQVDTLAELVRATLKEAGFRSKMAHLVVPSQFVVIRQLQLPDLPKKQLGRLIDFELQNSIHLPFDEPFYDFVKLGKASAPAPRPQSDMADGEQSVAAARENECDVTLIASSRPVIDSVVEVATKAGLKPQSVDIRALALYRSCRLVSGAEMGETAMFVDVEETSTDIHIFQGDTLKFTRNVPMSLETYRTNRDENRPLNVLDLLAFIEAGTDYRSFASDLGYEIERSLNFFRYTLNNRDAKLGHILLTGLLPKSDILASYLRERMPDIPFSAMPFGHLEIAKGAEQQADSLYEYAIPIGLALKEVK